MKNAENSAGRIVERCARRVAAVWVFVITLFGCDGIVLGWVDADDVSGEQSNLCRMATVRQIERWERNRNATTRAQFAAAGRHTATRDDRFRSASARLKWLSAREGLANPSGIKLVAPSGMMGRLG